VRRHHAPGEATGALGLDAIDLRAFEADADLGQLWLVPHPPFHAAGDFALAKPVSSLARRGERRWTYANPAPLRPAIVAGVAPGIRAPLAPLLFASADAGCLGGRAWPGVWNNLGTPEQLAAAEREPATRPAAP
jgi:MurNAc alpha-1-phosphate uridylyltransferase